MSPYYNQRSMRDVESETLTEHGDMIGFIIAIKDDRSVISYKEKHRFVRALVAWAAKSSSTIIDGLNKCHDLARRKRPMPWEGINDENS